MIREQKIEAACIRRNPHIEILREVAIFKHLDEAALHDLYRRMTVKRWHAGAIVVGQNEPGDAFFILMHGSARVVLFGENGREMTLSILRPSDFFGEMSLFDGKPRSANIIASEDSIFLVIDKAAFLQHLAVCPRTAMGLLGEMSDRLRKANEIINNLALHDVSSRLTRTLLALAEEGGEQRAEGILIRRRPTQQDLANMVGTCRETVSRTLSSMARRGLVVSRGRSILLSRELVDSLSAAA